MIRNSRHFMAPFSFLGVVLLMLACGNESSDKSQSSASPRQEEEERVGQVFRSHLLPLNTIVAGNSVGFMEWVVSSSKMKIQLSMTNSPEDLEHFQTVHAGSQCPTESADTNGDGIIDIEELKKVSGQVILTLDSNPASQAVEDFSSSRANTYGNYVYWSEVDNQLMRNIASSSSPENRVVVVYGVRQEYNLPSTVASHEGKVHRYVPISCGVIRAASTEKLY